MTLLQSVSSIFKSKFEREPLLVIAPGRINLIGEHTDYNNGFVMPAAVNKHLVFAVAPNHTDNFNFFSIDFNVSISFAASELQAGGQWQNYLMGVIDAMKKRGLGIGGVDCVFGGDIPSGGGMSSSAALCCGFGFALDKIFDLHLTRLELAKIGQYAEHNFAGVMCGIMDQYASLFGRKDAALLLDCRSLQHEHLPFDFPDIEILLINTKVSHALASTAYNNRRAACEEGVALLQRTRPEIISLRDVSIGELETLHTLASEDVFVKCRFVVKEIWRAQQGAALLRTRDLSGFGKLMFQTHWGLSKEYEVSCEESDMLVNLASTFPGEVLGARQMGGGFGGCTINLVRKDAVENYSLKVREKYVATFKKEPDFYSINLCEGVHSVMPNV
jgi:galactokinase